jgi:hypothetical protein
MNKHKTNLDNSRLCSIIIECDATSFTNRVCSIAVTRRRNTCIHPTVGRCFFEWNNNSTQIDRNERQFYRGIFCGNLYHLCLCLFIIYRHSIYSSSVGCNICLRICVVNQSDEYANNDCYFEHFKSFWISLKYHIYSLL